MSDARNAQTVCHQLAGRELSACLWLCSKCPNPTVRQVCRDGCYLTFNVRLKVCDAAYNLYAGLCWEVRSTCYQVVP